MVDNCSPSGQICVTSATSDIENIMISDSTLLKAVVKGLGFVLKYQFVELQGIKSGIVPGV